MIHSGYNKHVTEFETDFVADSVTFRQHSRSY